MPRAPADGAGIFISVSSGSRHTCAVVSPSGIVECFGANFDGEAPSTKSPSGNNTFVSVSAGVEHSCAVTSNGLVECWGNNDHGQAPQTNCEEIEADDIQGALYFHYIGDPDWTSPDCISTPLAPSDGVSVFTSVSVGRTNGASYSCALASSGVIECWGVRKSYAGMQSEHGQALASKAPADGVSKFVTVSTGSTHTCGLVSSGVIECWGSNSESQAPNDGATCATPLSLRPTPPNNGSLGFHLAAAAGNYRLGDGTERHCPPGVVSVGPLGDTLRQVGGESWFCFGSCFEGHYGISDIITDRNCDGQCPLGHFCASGQGAVPRPCPPGFYGPTVGLTACTSTCSVGNGTFCPLGSSQPKVCTTCRPGEYLKTSCTVSTDAECEKCSAGYFSDDGESCHPCREGTFSSEAGASFCARVDAGNMTVISETTFLRVAQSPCPAAEFSGGGSDTCESCKGEVSADGSTCTPCKPGSPYNPAVSSCSACISGTASNGESGCMPCGVGEFAGIGAAFCQTAGAGYKTNSDRSGQELCPKNTISLGAVDECTPCPLGSHTYGATGASSCHACDPGEFKNADSCEPCEAGRHSIVGAASVEGCEVCKNGTYSEPGASFCSVVSAGNEVSWNGLDKTLRTGEQPCKRGFSSNGNTDACQECAEQTFQPDGGKPSCAACSVCQPGTHISRACTSTSNAECEVCFAGFFTDKPDQSNCTKCTSGTSKTGSTFCSTCEAGKTLKENVCTSCDPGRFARAGESECTTCVRGRYSNDFQTDCLFCAAGKRGTKSGASSEESACVKCERGKYTNNIGGNTECSACAQGKRGRELEAPSLYVSEAESCEDCEPGTASAEFGTTRCFPCEVGSYASDAGSKACTPCQLGSYCPAAGMNRTTFCPKGTSCGARGLVAPNKCPEDSYQDEEGNPECKLCSSLGAERIFSRTFGIIGAWSDAACVACPTGGKCDENTVRQKMRMEINGTSTGDGDLPEVYTTSEWREHFSAGAVPMLGTSLSLPLQWCPPGCLCIEPEDHHYRFPPNTCVAQPLPGGDYGCDDCPIADMDCLACPLHEDVNMQHKCVSDVRSCNSSNLNGCSEGFTGYGCLTCESGFTRSGEHGCEACMGLTHTLILICLLAVVGVGVITYLIHSTIKSEGEPKDAKIMIIKLVMSHLQIVALVALFPLEWPKGVKAFLAVYAASSLSGGESALFSVDCALVEWELFPSPFYALAAVQASLPFIVLVLTGTFWVGLKHYRIYKGTHRPERHYRRYMVVSVVVVLFMLHITLTKTALALFTCTDEVDGGPAVGRHRFLEADTRIECFVGGHAMWAYGLGGMMLALFAFGIPFASFVVLHKVKSLGLVEWRPIFGFLCVVCMVDRCFLVLTHLLGTSRYSSYEERCWYWEVVVAGRKALFAAAAVLLQPKGVDIQANFGVLVIVTSLVLQLQMRPYAHHILNTMEAAALFTSFLTLCSGIFMFSKNTDDTWRGILTILIFVVNGLFLVFAGWRLYLEVKRTPKYPEATGDIGSKIASAMHTVLAKVGLGHRQKAGSQRLPTTDNPLNEPHTVTEQEIPAYSSSLKRT